MRNEASLLDCEEFDIRANAGRVHDFSLKRHFNIVLVTYLLFKFFIPYPVKTRDTPKSISQ